MAGPTADILTIHLCLSTMLAPCHDARWPAMPGVGVRQLEVVVAFTKAFVKGLLTRLKQ